MVFPIFLFFIDLLSAAFFEEPVIHLVAGYYFFLLLKTRKIFLVAVTLILVCLESFFYHGRFGTPLLLLVPMTWLCLKIKKSLIVNRVGYSLIVGAYLALMGLAVTPFFLGFRTAAPYTIAQIGATLAGVNIFY